VGARITRFGIPWLLGLSALSLSDVAAQEPLHAADLPTSKYALDGAGLEGEPTASRARYFFDDFSGATLDPHNWEAASGATLTHDVLDQGRVTAAVRLGRCDPGGADARPELRSVAIPLGSVSGAALTYTVQRQAVEPGKSLTVEYLSKDGHWNALERVVADDHASAGFSRHLCALPEDALHPAFRVRFRANAADEDDAWYLGQVCVVDYEPTHTLTVRLLPPGKAPVELVLVEGAEHLDNTTPFTCSLLHGASVRLTAPPVVGDRIFSHWSINDAVAADGERSLTLQVNEATEAVAQYQLWLPGRSAASVAIVSTPLPNVQVGLGPEPDRLLTPIVTDTEYACLTGERLDLLAPARTECSVFVRWVVNHEAQPDGQNRLEHRVGGDDVLVAEYVLLGDMNGDDRLDKFDVNEFVTALIDPACYAQRYPQLDRLQRGDINGDGVFDELDVEGFVDLLLAD
jgi:hypothetical protein